MIGTLLFPPCNVLSGFKYYFERIFIMRTIVEILGWVAKALFLDFNFRASGIVALIADFFKEFI